MLFSTPMKRKLPALLLPLLGLLLVQASSPCTAVACQCYRPDNLKLSPGPTVDGADTVFAGRVVYINDNFRIGSQSAVFEVSRVWMGSVRSQVVVLNGQVADCDDSFRLGREYIVYGSSGNNSHVWPRFCSMTSEILPPGEPLFDRTGAYRLESGSGQIGSSPMAHMQAVTPQDLEVLGPGYEPTAAANLLVPTFISKWRLALIPLIGLVVMIGYNVKMHTPRQWSQT
jgi:hypothetical protein